MGTDYTVFTNITFERLFARRGAGQEVQVLDADGNLSVAGITGLSNLTITGTLTSAAVTASGAITGATVTATGAVTGGSFSGGAFNGSAVVTSGAISGASLSVTGTASANVISSTTNISSGGQFLANNGTVGAPSYAFTNETDCGFYRSGTGTVDWVADGVAVARTQITSSRPTLVLNPGAASQITDIISGVNTQQTRLSGGTSASAGAVLILNGGGHASANAIDFQQSGTSCLSVSSAGLVTIGRSGGTQTHIVNGSLSLTGGSISGSIVEIKSVGQTVNLGMTLSSGTFTLTQANASALSSSAPAYIGLPSTTSGRLVVLKATSNKSFIDDVGSSEIVGEEFGVTTGVAFNQDRPFYIYAVNQNDTDAGLEFAISPNPTAVQSPDTANIAYRGVPASSPSDKNFFFLTTTNVTATHNQKPCVLVGCIRMRMSSSDDWTVQTLSSSEGDGINQTLYIGKKFILPTGQMGAQSGRHTVVSGGNAPTWATTPIYYYNIDPNGWVDCIFYTTEGGNCTNGDVGNPLKLAVPYKTNGSYYATTTSTYLPVGFAIRGGAVYSGINLSFLDGAVSTFNIGLSDLNNVAANSFSAAGDDMSFYFRYKAF